MTEDPREGKLEASSDGASEITYAGSRLRHVAMPIGGLGAGQIALGGDGGLRQWQIVNQVNYRGFVPDSFFAIRATSTEPPRNVIRVLQSREVLDRPDDPTPLVNDDDVPADQRHLVRDFPGVTRTDFRATYPFARVRYDDEALPVDVELEAYSPFVPLDAEASGLPAGLFTFTILNRGGVTMQGCLAATLQNAVGWDGITPISGNVCPLYGGNTNRVRRFADRTSIVMENPSLAEDHPGAGQMVLTALTAQARAYERWTTAGQFLRFMEGFNASRQFVGQDSTSARSYNNGPVMASGPSPQGTTFNGGLMVPFRLGPGEATSIGFLISWYFPNRYVNFDQFGRMRDYGLSRFWLGNAYATRFGDAMEVTDHFVHHRTWLGETSRSWEQTLRQSTLPAWLIEAVAAQGSLLRSPTCFWTEDGNFYGFEGSLGASTTMWNGDFGGSCPLNCTHVWNYEMALAKLFPSLEGRMRAIELDHVQAPEGYIPHRTILPLYLRQLWDEPIGGPTNPALDGMLGTILKTYREVRQSGDRAWFAQHWPQVKRLLGYIIDRWDGDNDGVLQGEQPNTYDIAFFGPNMYIGGLWLAALRAAEELARIASDEVSAGELRRRFDQGSARYDELLWNGEYYVQLLDPETPLENQFGEGCLADQLFGQWWAHLLDLGYILPREHVRTTLTSIVRYNVRHGFNDFVHGFRVYADRDDAGLLVCTWPRGGRPAVPVRYCDEVWTGIEYQVAAHCIMEGMVDEGMGLLVALRGRYSGARRNPYNEIECGDHYARAMAGWSVIDALSGLRTDALRDAFHLSPVNGSERSRLPFIVGTAWGTVSQARDGSGYHADLCPAFGHVALRELTVDGIGRGRVAVHLGSRALACETAWTGDRLVITLADRLVVGTNERLAIEIATDGSTGAGPPSPASVDPLAGPANGLDRQGGPA